MKDHEQLINNVIGQLDGVKKMLKENRECVDVITQLKASKSAINTAMNRLLEEHSRSCLRSLDKKDREKIASLLQEIIKNN